jgi:hypothetical protein
MHPDNPKAGGKNWELLIGSGTIFRFCKYEFPQPASPVVVTGSDTVRVDTSLYSVPYE